MQRLHQITFVIAVIFLMMGGLRYLIKPASDRPPLKTFEVKKMGAQAPVSQSLPSKPIAQTKNKSQPVATKTVQNKPKKQIETKTFDQNENTLSQNNDLMNPELVKHLKHPDFDESYLNEYFDDFLTDESISRTDKIEALWGLITQLDPSDPGYNVLLGHLELTTPVELTEELIGEYESATNPGTKFMLLELMRDSIIEMEEQGYRVDGETGTLNNNNDFNLSRNQNFGASERERIKQNFREFLKDQNEERGGVYEDEFEYEEFLDSFSSVYTLKETVTYMRDSIVR